MIQREFYLTRADKVDLFKTYSDSNFKIRQVETGRVYNQAIDVADTPYTYEETEELIEVVKDHEIADKPVNNPTDAEVVKVITTEVVE